MEFRFPSWYSNSARSGRYGTYVGSRVYSFGRYLAVAHLTHLRVISGIELMICWMLLMAHGPFGLPPERKASVSCFRRAAIALRSAGLSTLPTRVRGNASM